MTDHPPPRPDLPPVDSASEEEEEDDCDEPVDPRVQGELETLNCASDEINTLETELERARNRFRGLLADSTQRLNVQFKKLRRAVLNSRPYYELHKLSKEAQYEAQKAAVNFQRANSVYQAAKEMVQLAEERNFPEDGDKREFDAAWQEMLNHATMKFMESESEKKQSEENHLLKAAEYGAMQEKLRFYEKDLSRNINKAKPYFEMKERLEKHLKLQRMNVEDLQMGLVCAKHKYRSALTNLESISEEIHQKRKKQFQLPPRTPGVGAESYSDLTSLPSINLDNLSDTTSLASLDDLDAEGASIKDEFMEYVSQPPVTTKSSNDKSRPVLPEPPCPPQLQTQTTVHPSLQSQSNIVDKMKSLAVSSKTAPIGQRELAPEGSESMSNSVHHETPLTQTVATNNKSSILVGHVVKPGAYYGSSSPQQYHPNPGPASPGKTSSRSALPDTSTASSQYSSPRRKQRKSQSQAAFPILQGLTNTQAQLRPDMLSYQHHTAMPQIRPSAPKHGAPTAAKSAEQNGGSVQKTNSHKKDEVFV